MIRDEWQNWVLMAITVILWMIVLFGCAGPEPYRPIERYRAAFFFSQ